MLNRLYDFLKRLFSRKPNEYEQTVNERCKIADSPDILGDDVTMSVWTSEALVKETRPVGYSIIVYDFREAKWVYLHRCSETFLGVKGEEYFKLLKERYGAVYAHVNWKQQEPVLQTFEDAQRAVTDFRPYYESFYLPQALMSRLSAYTEGGLPPYFKDKAASLTQGPPMES